MKIGILGSGLMGSELGRLWAASGHDVVFAYSRDEAKLARLARENAADFGTVAEAVAAADVLLLAVHWSRVDDVLAQAGQLRDKVMLNCCVPLNEANTTLIVGTTTSGAEQLQSDRPEARWVACFNTCPSESFESVFSGKPDAAPPQVLMYGDDAQAKMTAHRLIGDIGFEPLDAGGTATARFVEPFAMVTAELACGQPGGPALTYRFDKRSR